MKFLSCFYVIFQVLLFYYYTVSIQWRRRRARRQSFTTQSITKNVALVNLLKLNFIETSSIISIIISVNLSTLRNVSEIKRRIRKKNNKYEMNRMNCLLCGSGSGDDGGGSDKHSSSLLKLSNLDVFMKRGLVLCSLRTKTICLHMAK